MSHRINVWEGDKLFHFKVTTSWYSCCQCYVSFCRSKKPFQLPTWWTQSSSTLIFAVRSYCRNNKAPVNMQLSQAIFVSLCITEKDRWDFQSWVALQYISKFYWQSLKLIRGKFALRITIQIISVQGTDPIENSSLNLLLIKSTKHLSGWRLSLFFCWSVLGTPKFSLWTLFSNLFRLSKSCMFHCKFGFYCIRRKISTKTTKKSLFTESLNFK